MLKMTALILPAAVVLLDLGIGGPASTFGRDLLARFDGGIGVDPVAAVAAPANGDGTFQNVTANVVRGVSPSGRAWRIGDLKAEIETDGHITVRGRGLRLAGGDRIGQSLGLQVGATLICEETSPFAQHSTAGLAQLDPNGDFRLDDTLIPAPAECASPLLLIRSGGNGPWLAAAIPDAGAED